MSRLVSVCVEDNDGDAPDGHHRIVITVDVPAETAWDAVGWAVEQLGAGQ